VRRRSFFSLLTVNLVAIALVVPVLSRAAAPAEKVVHIGFVLPGAYSSTTRGFKAFWERLRQLGWTEGENVIIDAAAAEGRIDLLPKLMASVVERKVDVIVTSGTPAAIAARNATKTIPIVNAAMGDPVGSGLAVSLARPGGNLTGFSTQLSEGIPAKWLQLLQETVPNLAVVAVVMNLERQPAGVVREWLNAAASARGIKLRFIEVHHAGEIDQAFAKARQDTQAVLVFPNWFTFYYREQIAASAVRYQLPDMYGFPDVMPSGGLLAYGADLIPLWERTAEYVDRILRGAKPADLPIQQATKVSLVVNLTRAKELGLTIPQSILLRADEVIR
jgi:putative ABC transport system substrate-binding protein